MAPPTSPHRTIARALALLALAAAVALGTLGLAAGPAAAASAAPAADPAPVIFIGDSVTAGFGYFGQRRTPPTSPAR